MVSSPNTFLEALEEPGLKLGDIFDGVRGRVYVASSGKQLPWTASSVIGSFVFRDPAAERAKLERRLEALKREAEAPARRKADEERREKEMEAAMLSARLDKTLPPAPKEDPEAERKRLEDLRQKIRQQESQLGEATTLEQARQEVASMVKKIADLQAEVNAAPQSGAAAPAAGVHGRKGHVRDDGGLRAPAG